MNESCPTYEWVMSHIWMSHVTRMNESCDSATASSALGNEGVMSHTWKSHDTHVVKSSSTHKWVRSHAWMSHIIVQRIHPLLFPACVHEPVTPWQSCHMNESCHTYEWVISHIWMSHITHMNESYHTNESVMICFNGFFFSYSQRVCMNESRHESHVTWTSHISHMNESCRTNEWVVS